MPLTLTVITCLPPQSVTCLCRVAANQQDNAAQLALHVLSLDVVRVLDLSPGANLPPDLEAGGLGGLLDAKLPLGTGLARVRQALGPLVEQACGDQDALAGQDGALEAGELVGGQGGDPAADDVLCVVGLVDGHDAVGVEDGLDVDAGPDGAGQVGDDAGGDLLLQLAQGLAVLADVVEDVGGGPAEQGVGGEVAHAQLDDRVADAGVAA